MYDIEKLVTLVCEWLEAETDDKQYNLEFRRKKGYAPDANLWIPSLDGSTAYRMGELSERAARSSRILADICMMLDIDQDRLIAAVKSMQRKERHNGRWDNPCLTQNMGDKDKEHLARFLRNDKGDRHQMATRLSSKRSRNGRKPKHDI